MGDREALRKGDEEALLQDREALKRRQISPPPGTEKPSKGYREALEKGNKYDLIQGQKSPQRETNKSSSRDRKALKGRQKSPQRETEKPSRRET